MFDVITIGTATRDALIRSKDFHTERDSHVLGGRGLVMPLGAKLEIPEIYFSTGGGATNAAVTFARQGFRTACVAVLGDDISGRAVWADLERERVFTGFLRKTSKPTAYSILLEPPSGERTVLVHRGASEDLNEKYIAWPRLKTRWFYISSLAGNMHLLKRIVDFAKKSGIFIAYNPGGRELKQKKDLLPLLKHIHILSVDREEASFVTGVPYWDVNRIFKVWDGMSPGINVMTDAKKGVWVSDGKYLYKAGIYREKRIVDRTGAGDAFGSGLVAGIMQKPKDIVRAIRLGSANATAKVEGVGAKYGLLIRKEFETHKRWKRLSVKITKL